ncbi:MAG: bifunctional DNA-formamidopyrimidine glycosylase/DNA-(apurinic or apyrimidinic site) lyase [Hyphomicrobiales bacterium]|nr:MAG: bifunctional DNA-formamidopyrimidine glycosylase/DNA-(apurinic or apyrimidinic site) lyase [Hyphomicrobiales bacterium]
MPELPEVETVRRGLQPVMEGARFAHVEQRRADLRFPFPERFAERLTGARVEALTRRAKYLLADLDTGEVLIMHLGMSGSFRILPAQDPKGFSDPEPGARLRDRPEGRPRGAVERRETGASDMMPEGDFYYARSKAEAHDHVVFTFENGDRVIYNDPRRFGFMILCARADLPAHPFFRDLGIEPLGNELDGAFLAARLAAKRTPLKAALLDQKTLAGLGNIYVCEALWRSGLSPRRVAATLATKAGGPTARSERLATAIRDVLTDAVAAGGSSLRDYVHTDGSLGYFQHSFSVYDREGEPCRKDGCGGTVTRTVQSGRSTFFCPKCQR